MKNTKYIFDEESATFKPIHSTNKNKWAVLLFGFIIILTLSFISINLTQTNYSSNDDLTQMKLQYKKLSEKFTKTQKTLREIAKKDNELYRAYFNLDSIPEDIRKAGFGGTNRYEKLNKLTFGNIISSTTKQLDILNKQLNIQSKSLNEILLVAKNKESLFSTIPAIQPIANKELKRIASGFGIRMHPILKIAKLHGGIDFSAAIGTPIYATANGIVEKAGNEGGYGNVTLINHKNGYKSLYGHQSKINVKPGQKVKRGEVIGYVGNTGLSSGPHLHYEIEKDGVKIDPITYFYQDLSPDEYNKLAKHSQELSMSFD